MSFTTLDAVVLVGYLVLTTALGALLAGKQSSLRDFFLGGRRLPWPAVAGSIIATEVSAVTFISVPAIAFAAGGNLTYLQLGLGAILARVIIGVWFVPAFYARELYSPYDYIGDKLGPPARAVTTALFMLGAVLGQSVRVLLTALILQSLVDLDLPYAIAIIGTVAILWTLLGGITTVIWTDVIQFIVFVGGLITALVFILARLPAGFDTLLADADAADKLRWLDLRTNPTLTFTLWTGLLANTVLCLNAYGTDQMVAQRLFCCRSVRAARAAIISSSLAQLLAVLAMFVGLGLYAYYNHHPLDPTDAASVQKSLDRIFPLFIIHELPPGLTGLILAAVFAAAISSLDSVLAALAQTTVSSLFRPRETTPNTASHQTADTTATDRRYVTLSRIFVVLWGITLCGMALLTLEALAFYGDILNLALAMASYVGGAILAAFLLALLPTRADWRGIVFSAPLSVLAVVALSWHQPWARWLTTIAAALTLLAWLASALTRTTRCLDMLLLARFAALCTCAGLIILLGWYRYPDITGVNVTWRYLTVAWPWNVPIGFIIAFTLGWLLADRRATA